MTVTLGDIARTVGAALPPGRDAVIIERPASLAAAGPADISFLANPRYAGSLAATRAAAVLVLPGTPVPEGSLALEVDVPYIAFMKVLGLFDTRSPADLAEGVHPAAVIHPTARIDTTASIGPGAVIGADVEVGPRTVIGPCSVLLRGVHIGADCLVYPNVTVMDACLVENRVIIHAGAVIGSDGFGFAPQSGSYTKIPQIGRVVIEDDVEIGACTCIDRAAFDDTVIARGTKLDNLIQIGHNVHVGPDTVIAAQTGVSGSTVIGARVMVGGQAGFAGHLKVGDDSRVGAQAGVTKDVPGNETVSGYPAAPHAKALRREAALTRLPDLLRRVRELEARIAMLEKSRDPSGG